MAANILLNVVCASKSILKQEVALLISVLDFKKKLSNF